MNVFLLATILGCMSEIAKCPRLYKHVRKWEQSICLELGVASWEGEEWEGV